MKSQEFLNELTDLVEEEGWQAYNSHGSLRLKHPDTGKPYSPLAAVISQYTDERVPTFQVYTYARSVLEMHHDVAMGMMLGAEDKWLAPIVRQKLGKALQLKLKK